MNRIGKVVALISGTIVGFGIAFAGMGNPNNILGFLDISGKWNPTLMGVLGGAVLVSLIGFYIAGKMKHPFFEEKFPIMNKTLIDKPLVIGGLLFGLGWGLAGYCPGPAMISLLLNNKEGMIVLISMILGGLIQPLIMKK